MEGLCLESDMGKSINYSKGYVRKVAFVVKAVWGIFNNTNGLYLQVNTLLVIYKSRYYSIYVQS